MAAFLSTDSPHDYSKSSDHRSSSSQRRKTTDVDVPRAPCQPRIRPTSASQRAKGCRLSALPDPSSEIFAPCSLHRISSLRRTIHREGKNSRKSSNGELCEKAEPSQYGSLPSSTSKPATWPPNTTPLLPSSSLIFSNGCPGPSSAPASRSAAPNPVPLPHRALLPPVSPPPLLLLKLRWSR